MRHSKTRKRGTPMSLACASGWCRRQEFCFCPLALVFWPQRVSSPLSAPRTPAASRGRLRGRASRAGCRSPPRASVGSALSAFPWRTRAWAMRSQLEAINSWRPTFSDKGRASRARVSTRGQFSRFRRMSNSSNGARRRECLGSVRCLGLCDPDAATPLTRGVVEAASAAQAANAGCGADCGSANGT